MPRFPHLLEQDAAVWQQFLDLHKDEYDYFDYDIAVGDGRDPGDGFAPKIRQMALTLSRRRIDVVGFKPDRIDIIEITQIAGLTALGQLHAYPLLYLRTFNPTRPLVPVLVCRSFATDAQPAFSRAGIEYYLFPSPAVESKGV